MFGTELVNGRGDSSGLQSCAFISTERIAENPTFPFMRLMSMSMLGVGVGFDTKGAGKVTLHNPSGVYPHVIPDSREGWVDSAGCLLRAFFTGGRLPNFDYSRIRPAGAPIKTFGGVAAGPEPLKKFHMKVVELLSGREGETLTSTDIVDIQNLIGKCVVSGNVRRSAEIALGDPGDEDFLNLKDWNINPERMGADGWGHSSNNSVLATSGQDYGYLAERIRLNGEPGLAWLDVAQNYGRLSDPPDYRDSKLAGVNPCGEQFLEDQELCTLAESFPANCTDLNDYLRTLKFCFLYSKSVVLLPTSWEETNSVMTRNRRIGLSMTGVAQFAEEHGWAELKRWQDAGYREIRKWDEIYSSWLGVRESIRVTTVKPSGTVSLLHGVTPGVHWPRERGFYVRTIRELKNSPLAEAMRDAGYPVEPSYSDPDTTVVISLPVEGPDIRAEHEVSIWEKVSLAAQCQRWWSDNAVSVTITFREDEGGQIPAVLRAFDGQLKSVSFLPMAEGVYRQAPYQRVSKADWDAMRAGVKPLDWDRLYSSDSLPEAEGENFCSSDFCELPVK
jgi:adenosylcobalamin-dependent ribonucleoside-triphosphate reductase